MQNRYEYAKEMYKKIGVDTDEAVKKLESFPISLHCWQGDDVLGFEGDNMLSGGIAATGNYPGKAMAPRQLMDDIDKALSLIPGKHRINLHAIYAFYEGEKADRDKLLPKHFEGWVSFGKARGIKFDFNPTLFAHKLSGDNLTLSHPDDEIRRFWIDHVKASRRIAEYLGREQGSPCLCNIWIPDGFKNAPVNKMAARARLKASLDEIFAEKLDREYITDSLESKLFGIGVEACTVGSHELYMNYAAQNGMLCLMDNGHYHPTESVADKLSAMLLFNKAVALHVTRAVRWDSDHVVTYEGEMIDIAREIVACNALDKVYLGLDYFDASINRIAAWVIGMRNMQKALLAALLMPMESLSAAEKEGRHTEVLAKTEDYKFYPVGDVWDYFCSKNNVLTGNEWFDEVLKYEREVLLKR